MLTILPLFFEHVHEILDSEKRIVILACILSRICGEFSLPTNNYTGFKDFVDMEVCIYHIKLK